MSVKKLRLFVVAFSLFLAACAPTPTMPTNYQTRSYESIRTSINTESSYIFYAGTSQCSICKSYKETLRTYLQDHEDRTMVYLDMEQVSSEDYLSLFNEMNDFLIANDRDDNLEGEERYFGVPTTFGYQNGVLVYVQMGKLTVSQLDALYEEIQ